MGHAFKFASCEALVAGLVCLVVGNRWSSAADPELDKQPKWSLSASNAEQNNQPFQIKDFEIRPPSQFRHIKQDNEPQVHYWVGPIRKDETYAQLFTIISDLTAEDAKIPLEKQFEGVVLAIKQRREKWSSIEIERGQINGHPFVRTSWTGIVAPGARKGLVGRTMHGVAYMGIFGNQAVQIQYQDVAPDHAESLKLGETAASTFQQSKSNQDKPKPPDLIIVSGDDKEMNAAMDKARKSVDDFVKAYENITKEQGDFGIKIAVRDGKSVEYFWARLTKYSDEKFTGIITNDPELVKTVKAGDKVDIEKDKICDWMYVEKKKLVGGYTVRVLRDRLSPAERKVLDDSIPYKIE